MASLFRGLWGDYGGTSTFAIQKKVGLTSGIRPSPTATRERRLSSAPFFLMFSKLLSLTLQGETPQPTVQYAHCPGSTGRFHGLTIREFFSESGPVSVDREINFPTTDGVCTQNTHSHNTFVHVQVIRTLPAQMCHSPREHAWLEGQHGSGWRIVVSPQRFRHPSVMSRMLPDLSLNTSTQSLSHLPHLSSHLLFLHYPVLWNCTKKPCEILTAEWRLY